MKEIADRLIKLCESESVYLNGDLTLEGLARMVGTNRTYLSLVLRDDLHTNFRDFINAKRISYAVQHLRNGKRNVKEVMYASGFNSYNSFRNAFYSVYNCTPGEFQSFSSLSSISAAV